jgi:hypothetical protein
MVGITGSACAAVSPELPVNLTPPQWVGHNFVFLALPADQQADGYGIFATDKATQGFQGDRSVRLPYLPNIGKIVTVTDVSANTTGANSYDYVVSMTEIGTGDKFVGHTISGSIEGLALVDDIVNARQQFLGQTIYPKSRSLEAVNDQPGGMNPTSVTIQLGESVTVTDVYAGIQSKEPIWLIITANGQKAVLPIAYSWTNQPVSAWKQNPPWQAVLFMADPKVSLGWSSTVWGQIESGVVQPGMTKEQIHLSWGPPNSVEQTAAGSVWYYGTKVLDFTGDTLTSMETVEGPTP